jgi:hypothetical protein
MLEDIDSESWLLVFLCCVSSACLTVVGGTRWQKSKVIDEVTANVYK